MKIFGVASVLLSLFIHDVLAHYRFESFIANGTTTSPYQYVRQNTNDVYPVKNVSSIDLRCNVGGLASGNSTQTFTVVAGSTVGFALDIPIFHNGVVNVYMAKVPSGSSASTFSASGNVWFKIFEITPITDGGTSITFPDYNAAEITFPLPKNLPNGQYLLRIEQIALHLALTYGNAEFYISCAQIDVVGGGNGVPGPSVSFPGYYTGYEPGILINIYSPVPATYIQPGPILWTG